MMITIRTPMIRLVWRLRWPRLPLWRTTSTQDTRDELVQLDSTAWAMVVTR